MLITDSESSHIIFTQAVDKRVKLKIPVFTYHAMKVHRWSEARLHTFISASQVGERLA
jgi:hypothetical protein